VGFLRSVDGVEESSLRQEIQLDEREKSRHKEDRAAGVEAGKNWVTECGSRSESESGLDRSRSQKKLNLTSFCLFVKEGSI
jgi:hypothetical protein